jgi:hypothetical protein
MRKRKIDVDDISTKQLNIIQHGSTHIFEIDDECTNDIAEVVSLLIKKKNVDYSIWDIKTSEFNTDIAVEKSLYWLTGGRKEWESLEHYKVKWHECVSEFKKEFEHIIIKIVKESNSLLDIKNGFLKYLNLPIIYEFALSKDFLK